MTGAPRGSRSSEGVSTVHAGQRDDGGRASRRSEPRFRLAPGLALRAAGEGGALLSDRPLVALRLNARGFAIVESIRGQATRGGSTPSEVLAAVPGAEAEPTRAFLERCSARGLLEREPPDAEDPLPSVSVVVPTHGRPAGVMECLEALERLDWPPERLEVIVVDDASPEAVASSAVGGPARVVRAPGSTPAGPAAARNLGARHASGDWIAFVDDDCFVDPGWLRALARHFAEEDVTAVGGRVGAFDRAGWLAAYEAVRSPLDMGPRGGDVAPGRPLAYVPSCNLAVRRGAFVGLGGFDEAMRVGEDVDLVWRLVAAGHRVRYAPEARVVHRHRTRLVPLLRRRAQYASSEAELSARHPAGRRRLVLPPLALGVLGAAVCAPIAPPVAGVALVGACAAGLREVVTKRSRLRALGVHASVRDVAAGVARAHGASLHHLGAHLVRYHGLPLAIAAALFPPLAGAVVPLALVPPIVDHRRARPDVPLPAYVALWWLEMAAYQLGVVAGALARRDPTSLFPELVLERRAQK